MQLNHKCCVEFGAQCTASIYICLGKCSVLYGGVCVRVARAQAAECASVKAHEYSTVLLL